MPKEKKLFQMAVNNRNNTGFTLVEILLYISFYGLVMALLLPCAEGIIKVDNRLEMEGFCQRLSAEVTALQQASLWGADLQNKLIVNNEQQVILTSSKTTITSINIKPCLFNITYNDPSSHRLHFKLFYQLWLPSIFY